MFYNTKESIYIVECGLRAVDIKEFYIYFLNSRQKQKIVTHFAIMYVYMSVVAISSVMREKDEREK